MNCYLENRNVVAKVNTFKWYFANSKIKQISAAILRIKLLPCKAKDVYSDNRKTIKEEDDIQENYSAFDVATKEIALLLIYKITYHNKLSKWEKSNRPMIGRVL